MPDTFGFGVSEEQALATLRAVFASPITMLDTSAIYGNGESERRIGLALREQGGLPPGWVLATKADRDAHTGDFSGLQMRRSVEESLQRLGLERLQLVYLHDPEHTTFENVMSPGGPLAVLQQLQAEGLIEHLGLSGGPIDMLLRYLAATDAFAVVITHNRYTLLNRSAEPLLAAAQASGIAVVNAAPYNSGILAAGPDANPRYAYREAPPSIIARARAIAALCADHGVPLAAAALQFSLRETRIATTVVGLTSPEQVDRTLELAKHSIPDALWEAIAAVGPVDMGDPEEGR
jgi:D-threo-aldose 1-dehydrogenase